MTIISIHNTYQQAGGEDQVFAAETVLLEQRQVSVLRHTVSNHLLSEISQAKAAALTLWNRKSCCTIRSLIREHRPDVVHFHNTFPLISPAAYYAAYAEGVPVVQTLHNYRLFCPNGILFRNGHTCEMCIGKSIAWPGIAHGCYRGNKAASAVVAAMQTFHRAIGTWKNKVDVYIALSKFSRHKFIQAGLPAEKIIVKPNFIDPDPGLGSGTSGKALFVGRLTEEKGLQTLMSAWQHLGNNFMLEIVGDGPLTETVKPLNTTTHDVNFLGRQSHEQVIKRMGEATCLIFPSIWYEGMPMTILESFATGTPVIASNLGAMAELIDHGRTGLLFEPGNPEDLTIKVQEFLAMPESRKQVMRKACRDEYLAKYTANRNYKMLMEIYEIAIDRAKSRK